MYESDNTLATRIEKLLAAIETWDRDHRDGAAVATWAVVDQAEDLLREALVELQPEGMVHHGHYEAIRNG